jgi:hypothetical protein
MTNKLTDTDYINILKFYKKTIPKSKRLLKKNAEDIIALKLCSCIKKIEPMNPQSESRSIGICTSTVINAKGLKRGTFKCKKNSKIQLSKGSRKNISIGTKKTRRNH